VAPASTAAISTAPDVPVGEIVKAFKQFAVVLPVSQSSILVIVTLYSVAGPVAAKALNELKSNIKTIKEFKVFFIKLFFC
jgi:hypothetical protein